MKRSLFLLFFALSLTVFGGSSENPFGVGFPHERILEMLSNRDVYWAQEYPGLVPYLSPNAEAILRAHNGSTGKMLRTWLEDPNRFVIAHVLLTLTGEGGRYSVSASNWNALRVTVTETGEARYDAMQMKSLKQKWAAATTAESK